jgi:hypothetical protein
MSGKFTLEAVLELARRLSVFIGVRLSKVSTALARRGPASSRPGEQGCRWRFPTYDVPPGTSMIEASRVEAAIGEEGLF